MYRGVTFGGVCGIPHIVLVLVLVQVTMAMAGTRIDDALDAIHGDPGVSDIALLK